MIEGGDDPGKYFAEGVFAPDLAMIKDFVRYYIDSSRGQLSSRPVISSGLNFAERKSPLVNPKTQAHGTKQFSTTSKAIQPSISMAAIQLIQWEPTSGEAKELIDWNRANQRAYTIVALVVIEQSQVALASLVFGSSPLTYGKYMSKPIPKFYYDKIKAAGSLENAVDNFWNNTLPHYFTQDKLYGIEQEQRPLEGVVKLRADFTIRYIKNGDPKKVVLMEDKRRGYETWGSKWAEALEQLTNYLTLVRAEQTGNEVLYGIVTIGTYVRFYFLEPGELIMEDYPTTETGKAYELKDDEAEIHKVLNDCVICGYLIDGYATASWLKEFRASMVSQIYDNDLVLIPSVYSSSKGAFISGVGRYSDPGGGEWIAPSDPAMRWDDHDYIFQASDRLPVMRQRPENGRHGFVLHDACWRLLQKASEPDSIPFERLLEVCRSLPFPLRGIGVCWGHDYGGLTLFDNQDHYPWEDRLMDQYGSSETCQYAKENPYDVPEIPRLLTMRSQKPPYLVPKTQGGDCFSTLPWEILEAIAINLQTGDALNLRRASKAFLPVLTSQTFWASRFEGGHDRDFIFEKRDNKESRDWITLYRITSHAHSPPRLKNRKRVWGLIRALINLLHLRLGDALESSCKNLSADGLRWSEVAGDVKQEIGSGYCKGFNEGCRLFQKQCASIPSDLSRIAFSITAAGNIEYVTGMRFITSSNADIRLGYMAEGNEHFLEVTAVRGFVLAIGPRGIRALQVIIGDGHASKWFGCPRDSPVTERLANFGSISALEVGVDGYKIVSLAIATLNLPHVLRPVAQGLQLRATALWYPTVPSPDLCLNEESFTGESPSAAGYQPLSWTRFGGPNGIYLRSLTEVCVTRLGGLCGIEFHYDTEDIPIETRKLGRRNFTDFSRVERFPINGPGGELIQTIDVSIERAAGKGVYSFYKHGKLSSFKASNVISN
ncbi:hypothetical protein FGG08_005148 [Glutinoglossum americanum]|uniref:F-box domain-containing protein n=1 Tax=Glutinoglossum americanum TaxID=1670608 RepID=A0A9P8L356_9PEZI|nr:hypothetical protein FGG08_005148 [Glutinoglossum americanum]